MLVGPAVTPSEWQAALQEAVLDGQKEDEQWVVQRLARIPVSEFPVVGTNGQVCMEPFYTVMGLAPTKYGVSILGRASQKQVVNVAQRGGMCSVLIGTAKTALAGGRLRGPGAPVVKGIAD